MPGSNGCRHNAANLISASLATAVISVLSTDIGCKLVAADLRRSLIFGKSIYYLRKGGANRLEEDNVRAVTLDLADNAGVELLAVLGTHVSLEGVLVLVGLLDVENTIVELVDLETDVARLGTDALGHLGEGILDELLMAGERLHSGVKNFGRHGDM